ncbi:Grx4 family monothiol glutaredoxin [Candidatus Marinamargulisbacteria bacterium SCGC AG-414-C22]|nr:Grx4 family monothiol glutaredoxin [Candidatus Marinamargulisbacteria bacterium SCGC AG-414-C22]
MDLTRATEEIKKDIKENNIILFMKGNKMAPMCGFSGQVVHILNQLEADYQTRDVLQDEELRQAIKDFSDWPTIPQLYVNEEFIGGCDIITELYQSGELKTLLA